MQFNNKFRFFGIIVGVLVLAGLVGVMALTVQRAQELTSTVTRPKAAGGCTGTGSAEVGNCGGWGKCTGDSSCGGGHYQPYPEGWTWDGCKSSFGDYICTRNVSENRCITSKKIDCSTKTDQSSCQAVSGCSWGGGSSGYTATSPIGGTQVSSLTPTFSWSGVPAGAAYQVICVGTNSNCNFPSCTADFGPSTTSYAMTSPLVANTQYYWMVYSQPGGNPAPSTGCQSFRTGAGANTTPNCTVTSPSGTNLVTGTNYTFSTTGSGSLTSIQTDGILSSQVYSNPQPWTHICQTNSTSCSGTTSFATAGQYYITCNANTATQKCSGDPSCTTNGGTTNCGAQWLDCGSSDSLLVTVTAVASCVTANCPDTQKCSNNSCVNVTCPKRPSDGCWNFDISNHACNTVNVADGTACTAAGVGSTCKSGVCTAPPQTASECQVCEGLAGKSCASGFICRKVSNPGADQGGICVKTDGTSQCGTCTTGANCTPPLDCADGKCVELSNLHLGCSGSTNGSCVKKIGPPPNTNSCTAVGASCSTTTCSGTTPDLCGTACTNKQTDSANCGACGTVCTTGQTCTSGSCVNNEANVCWGNGGTGTNAGRCYDCNGDGTVNILDFSCFRLNWLKPVQ